MYLASTQILNLVRKMLLWENKPYLAHAHDPNNCLSTWFDIFSFPKHVLHWIPHYTVFICSETSKIRLRWMVLIFQSFKNGGTNGRWCKNKYKGFLFCFFRKEMRTFFFFFNYISKSNIKCFSVETLFKNAFIKTDWKF